MLAILVASAKGGSGKSTISTGLAGYFARADKQCVLVDADPQHTALRWCARRDGHPQRPLAIDGRHRHWRRALPAGVQRLVVDTPAGSTPETLAPWYAEVHAVVVPVQLSCFDLEATRDFVLALRADPALRRARLPVALVANRVKPHTALGRDGLAELARWPVPLVAQLRDNQAYPLLAGLGRCLFDYASQAVLAQQADWQGLFAWLREVNRGRQR